MRTRNDRRAQAETARSARTPMSTREKPGTPRRSEDIHHRVESRLFLGDHVDRCATKIGSIRISKS